MLQDPSLDTWLYAVASPYKYSMQRYDGDGFQTTWELNFASGYISKSHAKAYTRDNTTGVITEVVLTDASFINPNTVEILPAVPMGTTLVIYRDTPKDGPLVVFSDGAVINEANLDTVTRQSIFTAAEMVDRFEEVNVLSNEATQNSLLAISTANAANAKADTVLSNSQVALLTAQSAEGVAFNAQQYALDALSTVTSANADASNALSLAQAANTNATAAVSTANTAINTANAAEFNSGNAVTQAGNAVATANNALTIAQAASDKVDTVDTALAEAQAAAGIATGASNSTAASRDEAQDILEEIQDILEEIQDTIGDLVSSTAIAEAITAHEAKPDPHPQYVLEADLGDLDFVKRNGANRHYCNLPAGFAVSLFHIHPDFDNEPDNPKFDFIIPAGQTLSTLEYPELYEVIGDTYAKGTMEPNTFLLPMPVTQLQTLVSAPDASWIGTDFIGNVKQHTHPTTTSTDGDHTHPLTTGATVGTAAYVARGSANGLVNVTASIAAGAHTHTVTVQNNATSSGIYNQPAGRAVLFAIALGHRVSLDGPYV